MSNLPISNFSRMFFLGVAGALIVISTATAKEAPENKKPSHSTARLRLSKLELNQLLKKENDDYKKYKAKIKIEIKERQQKLSKLRKASKRKGRSLASAGDDWPNFNTARSAWILSAKDAIKNSKLLGHIELLEDMIVTFLKDPTSYNDVNTIVNSFKAERAQSEEMALSVISGLDTLNTIPKRELYKKVVLFVGRFHNLSEIAASISKDLGIAFAKAEAKMSIALVNVSQATQRAEDSARALLIETAETMVLELSYDIAAIDSGFRGALNSLVSDQFHALTTDVFEQIINNNPALKNNKFLADAISKIPSVVNGVPLKDGLPDLTAIGNTLLTNGLNEVDAAINKGISFVKNVTNTVQDFPDLSTADQLRTAGDFANDVCTAFGNPKLGHTIHTITDVGVKISDTIKIISNANSSAGDNISAIGSVGSMVAMAFGDPGAANAIGSIANIGASLFSGNLVGVLNGVFSLFGGGGPDPTVQVIDAIADSTKKIENHLSQMSDVMVSRFATVDESIKITNDNVKISLGKLDDVLEGVSRLNLQIGEGVSQLYAAQVADTRQLGQQIDNVTLQVLSSQNAILASVQEASNSELINLRGLSLQLQRSDYNIYQKLTLIDDHVIAAAIANCVIDVGSDKLAATNSSFTSCRSVASYFATHDYPSVAKSTNQLANKCTDSLDLSLTEKGCLYAALSDPNTGSNMNKLIQTTSDPKYFVDGTNRAISYVPSPSDWIKNSSRYLGLLDKYPQYWPLTDLSELISISAEGDTFDTAAKVIATASRTTGGFGLNEGFFNGLIKKYLDYEKQFSQAILLQLQKATQVTELAGINPWGTPDQCVSANSTVGTTTGATTCSMSLASSKIPQTIPPCSPDQAWVSTVTLPSSGPQTIYQYNNINSSTDQNYTPILTPKDLNLPVPPLYQNAVQLGLGTVNYCYIAAFDVVRYTYGADAGKAWAYYEDGNAAPVNMPLVLYFKAAYQPKVTNVSGIGTSANPPLSKVFATATYISTDPFFTGVTAVIPGSANYPQGGFGTFAMAASTTSTITAGSQFRQLGDNFITKFQLSDSDSIGAKSYTLMQPYNRSSGQQSLSTFLGSIMTDCQFPRPTHIAQVNQPIRVNAVLDANMPDPLVYRDCGAYYSADDILLAAECLKGWRVGSELCDWWACYFPLYCGPGPNDYRWAGVKSYYADTKYSGHYRSCIRDNYVQAVVPTSCTAPPVTGTNVPYAFARVGFLSSAILQSQSYLDTNNTRATTNETDVMSAVTAELANRTVSIIGKVQTLANGTDSNSISSLADAKTRFDTMQKLIRFYVELSFPQSLKSSSVLQSLLYGKYRIPDAESVFPEDSSSQSILSAASLKRTILEAVQAGTSPTPSPTSTSTSSSSTQSLLVFNSIVDPLDQVAQEATQNLLKALRLATLNRVQDGVAVTEISDQILEVRMRIESMLASLTASNQSISVSKVISGLPADIQKALNAVSSTK